MTLYFSDPHLDVHIGDCRAVLAELPAESVHCVVTSPPYWGLRDYGTATWEGGDADCDHAPALSTPEALLGRSTLHGGIVSIITAQEKGARAFRGSCPKCGAIRQDEQLGLEATPEAYVAAMVEVFREVARVLRDDGTVWLNLGDSYATNGYSSHPTPKDGPPTPSGWDSERRGFSVPRTAVGSIKPKDLVGIPWRVAFALQADGWYLRSDIIWSKPNPMPESVTDRPTKAHEYVFLLTKAARYYFDADAVREPHLPVTLARIEKPLHQLHPDNIGVGIPPVSTERMGERFAHPNGRNLRSVWQIATEPYPGAHFATFPQKLVEPCIKAGTSDRGVCPECGAPWVREVDVAYEVGGSGGPPGRIGTPADARGEAGMHHPVPVRMTKTSTTTGWRPSCGCRNTNGQYADNGPHLPVPATVLDPFAGSGTTGLVANRLGRRAILIDLSADYLDQAMLRNIQKPLGL